MKSTYNTTTIIFDMDGTLYRLSGVFGGFAGSNLDKQVTQNAIDFVSKKTRLKNSSAERIVLKGKSSKLGISWYLRQKFSIDRAEYFNSVWNMSPEAFIEEYQYTYPILKILSSKYRLILLTSAPKIWKDSVLNYLSIEPYFEKVFTGDTYKRKDEIFKLLAKDNKPESYLSVGDQLLTDILPAKKLGMKTWLINRPRDLQKILR